MTVFDQAVFAMIGTAALAALMLVPYLRYAGNRLDRQLSARVMAHEASNSQPQEEKTQPNAGFSESESPWGLTDPVHAGSKRNLDLAAPYISTSKAARSKAVPEALASGAESAGGGGMHWQAPFVPGSPLRLEDGTWTICAFADVKAGGGIQWYEHTEMGDPSTAASGPLETIEIEVGGQILKGYLVKNPVSGVRPAGFSSLMAKPFDPLDLRAVMKAKRMSPDRKRKKAEH